MVHEIENFYGVYLLFCLNPKYKGRTYIGFTVNPNKRIQQHNKGKQAGGAWRTHGKGPWEMVLIIHGFPNMISALRFEWAWTKPKLSRRLKDLPNKKANEKKYDYCIKVLSHMVNTGPWNRLPLTIRWLKQEYQRDFAPTLEPPYHMPIEYGPVKCVKVKNDKCHEKDEPSELQVIHECLLCSKNIEKVSNNITCLNCNTIFHTICLADCFLNGPRTSTGAQTYKLVPVDGTCPKCFADVLWGDLVRYKRGCYQSKTFNNSSTPDGPSELDNDASFVEWTNNLEQTFS